MIIYFFIIIILYFFSPVNTDFNMHFFQVEQDLEQPGPVETVPTLNKRLEQITFGVCSDPNHSGILLLLGFFMEIGTLSNFAIKNSPTLLSLTAY